MHIQQKQRAQNALSAAEQAMGAPLKAAEKSHYPAHARALRGET